MADSRLMALYVHQNAAKDREIDRLHAALRQQRELMETYAQGWRENYEECGKDAGPCDCSEVADMRLALAEWREDAEKREGKIAALESRLAAAQKTSAEWEAEALTLREQVRDLSGQLRAFHEMRFALAEENHRDAG